MSPMQGHAGLKPFLEFAQFRITVTWLVRDEGVEVERFRTEAVLSGWERGLGTSSSRLLGVVAAIGRERERAGERRRMLQCGGNEEEKEGRTITATSHTQAPQGKYLRHAVTT